MYSFKEVFDALTSVDQPPESFPFGVVLSEVDILEKMSLLSVIDQTDKYNKFIQDLVRYICNDYTWELRLVKLHSSFQILKTQCVVFKLR
jgi:hypothetical protein